MGSWKLESGVDKGVVREKKKGRLKKQRKKKIVKFIVYIFTLALSGKAKLEN